MRGRVIREAVYSASTKLLQTWSWALDVSGRGIFTSSALFPEFIQAANAVKITSFCWGAAMLQL